VYSIWKCLSEEALSGIKIIYWYKNTKLCFWKESLFSCGVFAVSSHLCYNSYSSHVPGCLPPTHTHTYTHTHSAVIRLRSDSTIGLKEYYLNICRLKWISSSFCCKI
jgi:hypothetical protein